MKRRNIPITSILSEFEQSRDNIIYIMIRDWAGHHYKTWISAYNSWNRAINRGKFNIGMDVAHSYGFITLYKKDLFSATGADKSR